MTALASLRGAVGFLTRLPVEGREGDWDALTATPAAFPVVGYLVGGLAAMPLLASGHVPAATVAVGYVLAVYLLTGIHHLDGIADLGDAAAVHGGRERRRAVLSDTTTGVGALLAVVVVVVGLALGGLGLAAVAPMVAVGIVVASEVGAKLSMAAMACLGHASHAGMGRAFTASVDGSKLVVPAAVAIPATVLSWPHPASAAALIGAVLGGVIPWLWANRALGGVSGDVFGAANELGRLAGVHVGVIGWTLW